MRRWGGESSSLDARVCRTILVPGSCSPEVSVSPGGLGNASCVVRGTGRLHLSMEHLPGLGEEHPPSWCLCSLNCHQECDPSVTGAGCNQIERTEENRVQ